jgi:hypothetical protein
MPNQNPEQLARDIIDKQLTGCRWAIQCKNEIHLCAGIGVAIRESELITKRDALPLFHFESIPAG